jgi:hypothetical protein
MSPPPRDDASLGGASADPVASARRHGRRAANAAVVVVALIFIGVSAAQIIRAVFGVGVRRLDAVPGSPEHACAEGVRSLALALDRASVETCSPSSAEVDDGQDAVSAFDRRLGPEWDKGATIEQACARSSQGVDTWAALLRLREGEEQLVRRGRVELAPLRRDVAAHLPANLR